MGVGQSIRPSPFGGQKMINETIPHLRYLIAGKLRRDYVLLPNGKAINNSLGGSLIHSAVGAAIWEKDIGLVSRVGSDIPAEWIELIARAGFDIRGIHRTADIPNSLFFASFPDLDTRTHSEPFRHYQHAHHPFPKALVGYVHADSTIDSRTQASAYTLKTSDLPADYLDSTAAHIAPLDFLTHSLLPSALRQGHINTITLDPNSSYMNPTFWDDIPDILTGVTAFLTSEEKIRSLFHGRSNDLWEMSEVIGSYGCEMVVIKRGSRGQYLYDHPGRSRWVIPAYPARAVNPIGAGDAFCGGFLAGYRSRYNPLEAALFGNISASMVIEGMFPLFALDALPNLATARLDFLRNTAQKA